MSTMVARILPNPTELRALTREEFHHAIDAGVYDDAEKLELLHGLVFRKMPTNPRHMATTAQIGDWLRNTIPGGYSVRPPGPIAIEPYSEPEPDIAVVVGIQKDYVREHPLPAQILLIVEVSDSSLDRDLGIKRVLYAEGRLQEYWFVDIIGHRILVHREPDGSSYTQITEYGIDDVIHPSWRPDTSVAVRDLLP